MFCAGVDVAIGVNVIAEEGNTFAGTRIRALAEAAGFKLEPDGVFHYRNERRQTLFTLDNHEPAPFLPEQTQEPHDARRYAHARCAASRRWPGACWIACS